MAFELCRISPCCFPPLVPHSKQTHNAFPFLTQTAGKLNSHNAPNGCPQTRYTPISHRPPLPPRKHVDDGNNIYLCFE